MSALNVMSDVMLEPLPDPDEVATRAALLLSAPAAAVVTAGGVLGHSGLDVAQQAELLTWLESDPNAARSWSGALSRIARAPWPGLEGAEVWVLGAEVRRLPGAAYETLVAFLASMS